LARLYPPLSPIPAETFRLDFGGKYDYKNSIANKFKETTMAKREYSNYQKDVISNYYQNLDSITLVKLGELVSELFLAETDAKKDRLWERAHKAMLNLKIPPAIIGHIMAKKDVRILAKNLNDWLAHPPAKAK